MTRRASADAGANGAGEGAKNSLTLRRSANNVDQTAPSGFCHSGLGMNPK